MMSKYPFWVIKSDAKRLLRGKWNPLVLALFIPFLLFVAFQIKVTMQLDQMPPTPLQQQYIFLSDIVMLAFSMIMQLITVGIYENLKPTREKASFFLTYAVAFKKFFKMLPTLLVSIVFPYALAYLLSSDVMLRFYDYLMFSVMDLHIYKVILVILLYLLQILSVYLQYSLLLVPAITVEHPEYGGFRLIKESFAVSKGNRVYLFMLSLSFTGWLILGALAFYIGVLWAMLYLFSANYAYYRRLTVPEEPLHLD